MLDMVKEMAVAMARMEEMPVEAEAPATICEPEHVPPPLPMLFPPISKGPPAVGVHEIHGCATPQADGRWGARGSQAKAVCCWRELGSRAQSISLGCTRMTTLFLKMVHNCSIGVKIRT